MGYHLRESYGIIRGMKLKSIVWMAVVAAVGIVACVAFFGGGEATDVDGDPDDGVRQRSRVSDASARRAQRRAARRAAGEEDDDGGEEADSDDDDKEANAPMTEEEKREAEEDKCVEDFDALTDKWMEPSDDGVTMAEVDAFAAMFRKVPEARKEECLQRALNLVPDDNVMLLAGILMDKTQPKELLELVYNDILNRDEAVKNPILKQIYQDKEHPCWADTAWILDATGDTPGGKAKGDGDDDSGESDTN